MNRAINRAWGVGAAGARGKQGAPAPRVTAALTAFNDWERLKALRGLGIGLVAVCVGVGGIEPSRGQDVFRYDQTRPVPSMPEIRGVLPHGAAAYKPAIYQAEAGGWMVIADSFAAYRAAREAGITNHRPTLIEIPEAQPPDAPSAPPSPAGEGVEVAPGPALVPQLAFRPASVRQPASPPRPLPPDAYRPGDDRVLRIRCGDHERAEAAIQRLRAMGSPVTQTNLNRELGYDSTPSCTRPSGSRGATGSSPAPVASKPGAVNRTATLGPQAKSLAVQPAHVSPAPYWPATNNAFIPVPPTPARPPAPAVLHQTGSKTIDRSVRAVSR